MPVLVRTRKGEEETAAGCLDVLRAIDAWTQPPAPLGRINAAVKERVLNMHEDLDVETLTFVLSSAGGRALTMRKLRKHARIVAQHAKDGGEAASAAAARAAVLNQRLARWTGVPEEQLVSESLAQAVTFLDYVSGVLSASKKAGAANAFVAGASWTIADAAVTAFLARCAWFPETRILVSDRPALQRYFERMRSRPSFAHAHVNDSHKMGHALDDALHASAIPFLASGAWLAAHPLPLLRMPDLSWEHSAATLHSAAACVGDGMKAMWTVTADAATAVGKGALLVTGGVALGIAAAGAAVSGALHAPSMACWRGVNGYVVTPSLEAHNTLWHSSIKLITPAVEGVTAAAAAATAAVLPVGAAAYITGAPAQEDGDEADHDVEHKGGAAHQDNRPHPSTSGDAHAAATGLSAVAAAGAAMRKARKGSTSSAAKAAPTKLASKTLPPELLAAVGLPPEHGAGGIGIVNTTITVASALEKPAIDLDALTPVQRMRLETRKVIVAAKVKPAPAVVAPERPALPTRSVTTPVAPESFEVALPQSLAAAAPVLLLNAASTVVYGKPLRPRPVPDAPRPGASAREVAEARLARYHATKNNDAAAFALFTAVLAVSVFIGLVSTIMHAVM